MAVVHDTVTVRDTVATFRLPVPERADQWILGVLGLALTVYLSIKGIQWTRDKDRRDLLTQLDDDHSALLALTQQLDTFIAKNTRLPADGMRDLEFRLRGLDTHRQRLALLKRARVRHGLTQWFAALERLAASAKEEAELDEALHAPPDGSKLIGEFKESLLALRKSIKNVSALGDEAGELLREEQYGWLARYRKTKPAPNTSPPWADIAKRGFFAQT